MKNPIIIYNPQRLAEIFKVCMLLLQLSGDLSQDYDTEKMSAKMAKVCWKTLIEN